MLNRFSTLVEDNMMQNRQGTWDEVLCLGFSGERRSFRLKAYSIYKLALSFLREEFRLP